MAQLGNCDHDISPTYLDFQVNLPKGSTMCVPVKLSGHRTRLCFLAGTQSRLYSPVINLAMNIQLSSIIIGTFDLLWGSSASCNFGFGNFAFFDCFCMVPFLKTDLETLKSPWQRVRSFIFLDIVQKGSTPSTSWAVAPPPPPAAAASSSSCQIWFYLFIYHSYPIIYHIYDQPHTFSEKTSWGGFPKLNKVRPPSYKFV